MRPRALALASSFVAWMTAGTSLAPVLAPGYAGLSYGLGF